MKEVRRPGRRCAAVATLLALTASAAGPAADPEAKLTIDHEPLACVSTEIAPRIETAVRPAKDFVKGAVYFRAAGSEADYAVALSLDAETPFAVLPRPLPGTLSIEYSIEAAGHGGAHRSAVYVPPVVRGGACKTRGVPVGPDGAGLMIALTKEGQDPIPPGFNRKDIRLVVLPSGSVVTLAEALRLHGPSRGSGPSTAAIVAGSVVVAGGIAGGLLAGRAPTSFPTWTPTPKRTPTPTPTVRLLGQVAVEATWTGTADVDVRILDGAGRAVGKVFAAGCESAGRRTERVLLEGAVPAGSYRVLVSARPCGSSAPAQVPVALNMWSDNGSTCGSSFVNVPVGGAVQACAFTAP